MLFGQNACVMHYLEVGEFTEQRHLDQHEYLTLVWTHFKFLLVMGLDMIIQLITGPSPTFQKIATGQLSSSDELMKQFSLHHKTHSSTS